MREYISNQPETGKHLEFGCVPIEAIYLDPRCRDEITKLLRGLQEVYVNEQVRHQIFDCLSNMLLPEVSLDKGRKGFSLWAIFVLGMLRMTCDWDYDKLKNQAENHRQIRQMLGLNLFIDENKLLPLSTVYNNVGLFTEEIACKVSQIIVDYGHQNVLKKNGELHTRCDSYVLKSNAHFPTDYNLLLDSFRKVVKLSAKAAESGNLRGWREQNSYLKKFKRLYNRLSKMRYSNSQNEQRKKERIEEIHHVVKMYLYEAEKVFKKAEEALPDLDRVDLSYFHEQIKVYLNYGRTFINQINRRVLKDETISADEKIYSIFEPYTEWISKGKAGVPVELGVRLCVVEDQHGFILHHRMMYKEQDVDVAVDIIKDTKVKFCSLSSVSFDKGFHSKKDCSGRNNRMKIEESGIKAYLPVKGKPNKSDKEREASEEFGKARRQHPAIESAINALQCHALNRCPDKGKKRLQRYAAMGILAHNIHKIGAIMIQRDLATERQAA